MGFKEVSRVEITEVIRQWQAHRGIHQIARSTGLSRNTIRRYIMAALACMVELGSRRIGRNLDNVAGVQVRTQEASDKSRSARSVIKVGGT